MSLAVILAIFILGFLAYVRLAPSDVARWDQPIEATRSEDMAGGAVRVLDADEAAFDRVVAAARALPRTEVLAGSADVGRVTFITRSKLFGFPDYTTIEHSGGLLKMYARLRFGRSDMGVNAERLQGLLSTIEGG